MKHIFLGKLLHWILLIALVGAGWVTGLKKLHVIHFNWFLTALLVVSVVIVLLVLKTTGRDEQVTRDPLPEND